MKARLSILTVLALVAGCGRPPFSPHRLDSSSRDISSFLRGMGSIRRAPGNSLGRPMAFVALSAPEEVAAVTLDDGRVLWRQGVSGLSSRIIVGHKNIYYLAGGAKVRVEARSVADGRLVWKRALGVGPQQGVYGLAADRDTLFVVVGSTGAFAPGQWSSYIEAIRGADGGTLWRRKAPGRLGAPAAAGGYVFLPYRQQYLSVLDAAKGREVLRVRAREEYVTFVRVTPEGIYFGGEHGAFKLNGKAALGMKKKADFVQLAGPGGKMGLLGSKGAKGIRIAYYWDGYEPVMVKYTAYDRNRLLWRGRGAGFAADRAVLEYFRYFFGFDTKTGRLSWVSVEPDTDVRSAAHLGKVILYVTDKGKFVALDPVSGDRLWAKKLGIDVQGATFDAEGFVPSDGNRVAAAPLVDALKTVVFDPDRRLSVAKLFALSQLKGLKGKEVTRILLTILKDPKLPLSVRLGAEEVMMERVSPESVPLLLSVLKAHFNYVTGVRPIAVGPVAKALGKMKVRRAVPLLAAHLEDPNTPFSTIRDLVDAMARIGGKGVLRPFRQFLLDYRSDPALQRHMDVLYRMARYLVEHGAAAERQLLAFVAEDPHSLAPLKKYVQSLLQDRPIRPVD